MGRNSKNEESALEAASKHQHLDGRSSGDNDTGSYRAYSYRWLILAIIAIVGHNNSLMFGNLSFIGGQLSVLYDVPESLINAIFVALFYGCYFLSCGPALYVAGRVDSLYISTNVAAWTLFLGQILRFAQPEGGHALIVAGTVIAALSSPWLLGSFTQMSKNVLPITILHD